jgi:hypothetical protein
MFGQSNTSTHSHLIMSIWTLRQDPAESIAVFFHRATSLYDQLMRSGGLMQPDVFLQCFEEGLQEAFSLTVKLLQNGPPALHTLSCLHGQLLAEEARVGRQQGLQQRGYIQGVAGAVTDGGAQQHGASRGGAGSSAGRSLATPTCWNCGETGHVIKFCKQPLTKPYKFKPADWVSQYSRDKKPAPAPGASSGLQA